MSASTVSSSDSPVEAISQAVRTRVRPIFMSTMTSVGGMLPLVLVPLMLGLMIDMSRGLRQLLGWKPDPVLSSPRAAAAA
ncbi:MAG: efflux RND transporter permease subunit [Planctomycetota bacterium]